MKKSYAPHGGKKGRESSIGKEGGGLTRRCLCLHICGLAKKRELLVRAGRRGRGRGKRGRSPEKKTDTQTSYRCRGSFEKRKRRISFQGGGQGVNCPEKGAPIDALEKKIGTTNRSWNGRKGEGTFMFVFGESFGPHFQTWRKEFICTSGQ